MSSSRKRKNRPGTHVFISENVVDNPPDPALFIQAYEADILRGPQAKQAADSLDIAQHLSHRGDRAKPSGLIQWNPSNLRTAPAFPSDADDNFVSSSPNRTVNDAIWVDRYDARLLLESLPKLKSGPSSTSPPSPTGWSDLPSDSEDTFFFSPHEADDYRREKRRKLMDQAREERLKARRAEDGEPEEEDVWPWGGSDEEPDEAQAELMERTAASIMSTGNPAQLEMRILANYGADKRFAFLRGRWKAAWTAMKRKAQRDQDAKKSSPVSKNTSATAATGGLGNLADYGDSDADDGDDENEDEVEAVPDTQADAETALAARQARAKAWAELRRASKSNTSDVS
ncbi:hypothetical protein B0H19DRAFT_1150228 [Mycena capillaripes]|nr:hypothetical protein B0H19DRAFT_1150228 [Mycena capillaripes]